MHPRLPALVLQFMADDGPGYLGTWARRHSLRLDVVSAASGSAFPPTIDGYGAMAVLGGAMSANDDLPQLRAAERLIAACVDANVPVLGHCLGGQLMARTLGAAVRSSPAPEVGWHAMRCLPGEQARAWFGPDIEHTVFHWHYDAFDLPRGATALATSPACAVQAFAVGPHLAMQFHVEVDVGKIDAWLADPDDRYHAERRQHATMQDPAAVHALTKRCLAMQHKLADRIYARWLSAHRGISQ